MSETRQYRVVVSKRAAHQLVKHTAFAARLEGAYALNLMDEFQAAADSLASMPYRMPAFEADELPGKRYRKMVFGKWYLLLYKIQDHTVYIEYMIDSRQDYKWLLP